MSPHLKVPHLNLCASPPSPVTPEYPKGRKIIVIANDITFKIGSFGPAEDDYFFKATELARRSGLPRIYLSANSGARLGIAEELVHLFKAAWNDPSDPHKGVKYLYLTPETLSSLAKKGSSCITQEIEDDGERRHKITGIIGLQDGLVRFCFPPSPLDQLLTSSLLRSCRVSSLSEALV